MTRRKHYPLLAPGFQSWRAEFPEEECLGSASRHTPWMLRRAISRKCPGGDKTHPDILRLQGFNALSHIAVVDIAAVNFHEMGESSGFVFGALVG